MGITELVSEMFALKAKLREFLMGYCVAIVTTNEKKINTTCWPMIGLLFHTITATFRDFGTNVFQARSKVVFDKMTQQSHVLSQFPVILENIYTCQLLVDHLRYLF